MNTVFYLVKDCKGQKIAEFINTRNCLIFTNLEEAKECYINDVKNGILDTRVFKINISMDHIIGAINAASFGYGYGSNVEIINEEFILKKELDAIQKELLIKKSKEEIEELRRSNKYHHGVLNKNNKLIDKLSKNISKNEEVSLAGTILGGLAVNTILSVAGSNYISNKTNQNIPATIEA